MIIIGTSFFLSFKYIFTNDYILSWMHSFFEPKFDDKEVESKPKPKSVDEQKKITIKNSAFDFLSDYHDDIIFDILRTVLSIQDVFKFITYKNLAKSRNKDFTKYFFLLQLKEENRNDVTKIDEDFERIYKGIKLLQKYKNDYDELSKDKPFLKYIEKKIQKKEIFVPAHPLTEKESLEAKGFLKKEKAYALRPRCVPPSSIE